MLSLLVTVASAAPCVGSIESLAPGARGDEVEVAFRCRPYCVDARTCEPM